MSLCYVFKWEIAFTAIQMILPKYITCGTFEDFPFS